MTSRSDIYEKFGVTAEAAQLLETEISTCLLALEALNKDWIKSPRPNDAKDYLAKIEKMTLGISQAALRKHLNIEKEELAFLEKALETRNKLFHGFYERHNFRIETDEGRTFMFEDLETMHQTLFDAWQQLCYLGQVLSGTVRLHKRVEEGTTNNWPTDPRTTLTSATG